jgi:DUF1680 family protein
MDRTTIAPVLPTERARAALRPIDQRGVRLSTGFWADRVRVNRECTLHHGAEQLEASGAIPNLRRAGTVQGVAVGGYRGGLDDAGVTFPFLDSDVYKWLEAVGWELGRGEEPALRSTAEAVISVVEAAQTDDGYLGSYVQLTGRHPFHDLAWGHELYCIGHLAQAAVAWSRALADDRLLVVAQRAVERIDAELGEGRRDGIDGHPEIEMALVELARLTGDARYLAMARRQIELRGWGLLGPGRFGPGYWQDVLPVREAPTVSGHAVRQVYLDCGAVDLAVETGDRALLEAVVRRWDEMRARRTYLTGALGSRHAGEAFGDPWELPPDRAYAETCAAIGSVMLAWRLLLATGEARFADAIERALFNAVEPGISPDGTAFFYVNPLQVRPGGTGYGGAEVAGRRPWYACACCPPNLMRTFASLEAMLATTDPTGIQLWQIASADIDAELAGEPVRLVVRTRYPLDGRVEIRVEATPGRPWTLAIRVPPWCPRVAVEVDAGSLPTVVDSGMVRITRDWRAGAVVKMDLEVTPRLTLPDPRVDAVRGCAAVEHGPLVLCLEQVDLPEGVALEDVRLVPGDLRVAGSELFGTLPVVEAEGVVLAAARCEWPYGPESGGPRDGTRIPLRFVPYARWATRAPGEMRVWVPLA